MVSGWFLFRFWFKLLLFAVCLVVDSFRPTFIFGRYFLIYVDYFMLFIIESDGVRQ